MYREMDSDGQYVLDCRLDHEKSLEANTKLFIDFAAELRKEEMKSLKVKNRHEGYGFLAEAHQNLIRACKAVKDSMTDLLDALPSDDQDAVDKVVQIATVLETCVLDAAKMAAEAHRVENDLFNENWSASTDSPSEDGFADVMPLPDDGEGGE